MAPPAGNDKTENRTAPEGPRSDGLNREAKGLSEVLAAELRELRQRRRGVSKQLNAAPKQTKSLFGHVPYATKVDDLEGERITVEAEQITVEAEGVTVEAERITIEAERVADDPIQDAHLLRPLGVCLSGIRSATFNLGLLQGLCGQGLPPYIDYLSTVSGGGYIGSWLHGVIRNKNKYHGNPVKAQDDLKPGKEHCEPGGDQETKYQDPIAFLRKYSSYLAPHHGIFRADTWTMVGVWLRNTALNTLLILVPFFVCPATIRIGG
jgi:hypothetical protein